MSTATQLPGRKHIALIAHDNRKPDMLDWARFNRETLKAHELHATGTTGALIANELGLPVHRFLSGPLGGDQPGGPRSRPRIGGGRPGSRGASGSRVWTAPS